jgi:hypothetical protein
MIHATFRTRRTRAVCFDLENRPLAYWYDGQTTSEITAFGWKWSDEPVVRTMLLRGDGSFLCDDGSTLPGHAAYRRFANILEASDLVYGHNIVRHDLPMLNAGLLRRELRTLGELRVSDTCRHLPRTAGVSKSLENMAAMYGLEGEKQKMSQPDWEDANRLTLAGVERARGRVVSDVLLQERLRDRLLELDVLKPPRTWTA